jgi:hypothetical protein
VALSSTPAGKADGQREGKKGKLPGKNSTYEDSRVIRKEVLPGAIKYNF